MSWHIEHNNTADGSWKPELRGRVLSEKCAKREADRLTKIAKLKLVPWRYRAVEDVTVRS
jgi:hypothetical protein